MGVNPKKPTPNLDNLINSIVKLAHVLRTVNRHYTILPGAQVGSVVLDEIMMPRTGRSALGRACVHTNDTPLSSEAWAYSIASLFCPFEGTALANLEKCLRRIARILIEVYPEADRNSLI